MPDTKPKREISEIERKASEYFGKYFGENTAKGQEQSHDTSSDSLRKYQKMSPEELLKLSQKSQQGLVSSLGLSSSGFRMRLGDSGTGMSEAEKEALNRDITLHLLKGMPVIPIIPNKQGGGGLGGIDTMATDGERIIISLPMMAYFHDRPDEFIFALLHEVMHVVLGHINHFGGRGYSRCVPPVYVNGKPTYPNDPAGRYISEFWNWAMDAIINDMLTNDRIGKRPEFGVYFPGARLMTSEEAFSTITLMSCERLAKILNVTTSAPTIQEEQDVEERVLAAEKEYRRLFAIMQEQVREAIQNIKKTPQGQGNSSPPPGGGGGNSQRQGDSQGQGDATPTSSSSEGKQAGKGESKGQDEKGEKNGSGGFGKRSGNDNPAQPGTNISNEIIDEIMRQISEEILGAGANKQLDDHAVSQNEYDKVAESVEKQGQGKYEDEIKARIAQQVNDFAKANGLSSDDIKSLGVGIGTGHSFWGDLIGVVDDLRKKRRSWDSAVRAALSSCFEPNREDGWNDYLRPHRKTGVMGQLSKSSRKIIYPTKKKRYGRMTFVVDVSGSMSNEDVKNAMSEVLRMSSRMGEGHYITIIEVDAQICRPPLHFQIGETDYRRYVKKSLGQGNVKEKGITRSGYGGTVFKEAFDYINGIKEDDTPVSAKERMEKARINAIQSDVIIVLTDGGIFDLDQLKKPRGKVLWLIINDNFHVDDAKFPFGEVYQIKQLEAEKGSTREEEQELAR